MADEDAQTKATHLAILAKNAIPKWTGQLTYDKLVKETTLIAERGCESIFLQWVGNRLAQRPEYRLLSRTYFLPSQHAVTQVITGHPDIIKILKINNGKRNPVKLVEQYRNLPFDPVEDDDVTILAAMVDNKIYWYNSLSMKIESAYVKMPKKKSAHFELKRVGHRRMFNFTEPDTGMRSVMLDQIIKVGS